VWGVECGGVGCGVWRCGVWTLETWGMVCGGVGCILYKRGRRGCIGVELLVMWECEGGWVWNFGV
jgi:hypothetical protein